MVAVDIELDLFYQRVNDYWYHHSNSTLGHVTAVSTGGGYRDYQVRSGLTSLVDVMHSLLLFLFIFNVNMFTYFYLSFGFHIKKSH